MSGETNAICGTVRRPWIPIPDGSYLLIPVGNARHATIDLADLSLVSGFAWSLGSHGYAVTQRNRRSIFMHRLIVGATRGIVVDHRDFDGLNNRRENLRRCSATSNVQYRRSWRGKSPFKGAAFHKGSGLFHATIVVDKRQISLGYFRTDLEAALAYDVAALEHFGEFALTNKDMGILP